MKKVTYLFILMFSLVLMSTSCEKEDPVILSLEEQYPDWVNLTWFSTNGESDVTTYPKLYISIDGDIVTFKIHEVYGTYGTKLKEFNYVGFDVTETTAIFSDGYDSENEYKVLIILTPPDNNHKKVKFENNIYVLKIN